MGEWPFDVMIFGAAVISVAACFDLKRLMISASVGYFPSFFAGRAVGSRMLVNSHDGLPTDTVWIWVCGVFPCCHTARNCFRSAEKDEKALK